MRIGVFYLCLVTVQMKEEHTIDDDDDDFYNSSFSSAVDDNSSNSRQFVTQVALYLTKLRKLQRHLIKVIKKIG